MDTEATKDGRLSSSHHLTFLVEIPTKKNLVQQQSICDDVTSTRRFVRESQSGTSEAAQRMITLVQGDLYEILSQLLRKSHNSKLILEQKESLKMLSYKMKKR